MSGKGYKVGYGKPPKHSQFPPGVSGFKGRKKKRPEGQAEIIARVRDEMVEIDGKQVSMFELAIRSVFTKAIKNGRPGDIKAILDLLNQHGLVPEAERAAEIKANADKVIEKMYNYMYRSRDIDPEDMKALERCGLHEANLIMSCPTCGPRLRNYWANPERKALYRRLNHGTGLQQQVFKLFESRK